VLFHQPMITMNKLFQHWDTPIKLRRFKTKPLLTKVKPTNWSELWRHKKKNLLTKLKKCKRCSKSLTWVSWTQICSISNWKSSMKPENNWDTILKSWMTWQWPRRKKLSTKKRSSILKLNLTKQSHIYPIWMKILNWAEKSTI